MAKALKRPQSFISSCKIGQRRIDAVELKRFAKLYGKPMSFFVGEG